MHNLVCKGGGRCYEKMLGKNIFTSVSFRKVYTRTIVRTSNSLIAHQLGTFEKQFSIFIGNTYQKIDDAQHSSFTVMVPLSYLPETLYKVLVKITLIKWHFKKA